MKSINIFEFTDYREFIRKKIASQPRSGRGELLRIAKHSGLHTTTFSQIMRGTRELSPESALMVCEYFGLSEAGSRHFLLLVHRSRAGTSALRAALDRQVEESRKQARDLSRLIPKDTTLSEQEKSTFYSNWFYSAARVLTSIPGYQTPESISERLSLPRLLVTEVVGFLLRTGLCVEGKGGLEPGPKYTHLDARSPLISRHHGNWRVRAMDRHPRMGADEVSYTSPMSLSKADAARVQKLIVELVEDVNKIRGPSACEVAMCLNIDWLQF